MSTHIHHNHRCPWFSSKPVIFPVHILYPRPHLSLSPRTCTQYEPPALPATSHTHAQFAGPAHVLLSGPLPRHHPVSCVHQQALHMSYPSYTHPVLFHSTWSFIATGYPEHFTFPSVVQQMCPTGTEREWESWKCSQSPNERNSQLPAHMRVFPLFSSC